MRDLTIIADDLTGAADCGVAFAGAGIATFVTLAAAPAGARVVAVDTDSRWRTEGEAASRAGAAARQAYAEGTRHLYKKIDSTLRGHVNAELAAVLAAAPPGARLILAPAFPAMGRTVRDGRVFVDGVALVETARWHDASSPMLDADSDDDLRRIAEDGAGTGGPVLWVGSAGLARHLPRALGLAADAPRAFVSERSGPIVVLVGSRSPRARAQAARLASELSGDVLAQAPLELDQPAQVAARLAAVVASHGGRVSGLVATGGETARAALVAVGASGIDLVGEVEPGVALGIADTRPPLPVVTKAGAFGDDDTLVRARDALHRFIADSSRRS